MNGIDPAEREALLFAMPHMFWALLIVPVLIALFFRAKQQRRKALDLIMARPLQRRLAAGVSESRRVVRFSLALLGLALGVVALARPQWGFTWEESKRQGRDVILAIDTSRSMLATDLQPDRLKRAKLAAEDIISQLEGDRVGLIAFAGTAFLQAPLTVDYSAARESLNEFDTEIIPRGGTNLTAAIAEAEKAFGKGESQHRALIIFSDGEELEADAVAAAAKQKANFRIFTVGVGTAQGGLIPFRSERGGTDFVRGNDREVVTSRLDEKRLQEVAQATGGFYVRLDNGPAAIRQIITEGLAKMSTQDINARMKRLPIERYQWPLGGAVIALVLSVLLGERRLGLSKAAVIALLMAVPHPAHAKNEREKLYETKDYKAAMEAFEKEAKRNPAPELDYNLGCAAYAAGDYDKAAEAFGRAMARGDSTLQAKSAYNLGNTLAARGEEQKDKKDKLKDWINAGEHFESATKLAPQDKDATYNLDEARKMIQQLQMEEEKEKEEKEEKEKGDGKKEEEKKKDEGKSEKEKGEDGEKGDKEKEEGDKQEKSDSQDGKDGDKGEEKKDDAGKDGEKGEEKDEQAKKDGEKGEEGNDGEKKDGKDGEKSDKEGQQQPEPKQPEQMKEGDVKSAQEQGGEQKESAEQGKPGEAMAEAQKEGMSEQDAKNLFNSLKKLDRRVRLFELDREQQREIQRGQFKDW